MIALALLIFLHVLFEFYIEKTSPVENVKRTFGAIAIHALMWTLLLGFVLVFYNKLALWELPFLFVFHYYVDIWKENIGVPRNYTLTLFLDQFFHVLSIVIVWWL